MISSKNSLRSIHWETPLQVLWPIQSFIRLHLFFSKKPVDVLDMDWCHDLAKKNRNSRWDSRWFKASSHDQPWYDPLCYFNEANREVFPAKRYWLQAWSLMLGTCSERFAPARFPYLVHVSTLYSYIPRRIPEDPVASSCCFIDDVDVPASTWFLGVRNFWGLVTWFRGHS